MPIIRILTAADVRSALSMADAIEATRTAFAQLSSGEAVVPVRTQLSATHGTTLLMPAYLPVDRGLGAKLVSVFPGNPAFGLPTVTALVALLDAETGRPIALLDGTYLTALRTGAASGVAADILALPAVETMALFGAGVQARTQLLAACTVRYIRRAWVYDRNSDRAARLVAEMAGSEGIPADLRVAASPAEALREAGLVATATTSNVPVFADGDLLPGTHISAVGAFTPQMQEVPSETVARARVFVDQRTAALAEAGDLIVPIQEGRLDPARLVEIGEVINGQATGRESAEQVTLFKSVGNAVQDIAAATRRATHRRRAWAGHHCRAIVAYLTRKGVHPVMLPETADVVVIGGGVMGVSTAYHLATRGCRKVVLLERAGFLGSESTGKCAGGIRYQFSTEINVRLSLTQPAHAGSIRGRAGPEHRSAPDRLSVSAGQ